MKIKRYILMAGMIYYASGGFKDFAGSFDTKKEALAAKDTWLKEHDYGHEWWHIADLEEGTIEGEGGGCNPMGVFM